MATKAENQGDFNSCWNRAADDEPIFILRAHDPLAPDAVRRWAFARMLARGGRDEAAAQAVDVADAMAVWRDKDEWRKKHHGR